MSDILSPSEVTLEPRLDLTAASALSDMLKEKRGAPITINAEQVEHLGSQCLQVLISAAITWRSDNNDLSYSGQSSAFSEALSNFGVPFEIVTTVGEN